MKSINKYGLIILFTIYFGICVQAQSGVNEYGLKIITEIHDYQDAIMNDSSNIFIDLKQYIPDIVSDIKYATTDNFLKEAVYTQPMAFARKPVAGALKKIQEELKSQGLGLKVFDAYRPYRATVYFYEKVRDSVFVSVPWKGLRHNRGCAVDVSI